MKMIDSFILDRKVAVNIKMKPGSLEMLMRDFFLNELYV